MTTEQTQLSLLACHTDEELLGSVLLYRLPEVKIDSAWKKLREEYRGITGSTANLPYSGLLTVLRAIGYTSATLYPTSKAHPPKFLATTRPIDRDDLHAAVTLWEQALLQTPADSFTFQYPSQIADLIAGTAPEQVQLWDQITRTTACIDAPGWVWTAAGWAIAEKLAAQTWEIDGKTVTFRRDLANCLQVWDRDLLWSNTWLAARGETLEDIADDEDDSDNAWKTAARYATLRLDVMMKSHPGLSHPVAVVQPSVSRLSNTLRSARTAWFEPRDAKGPLLNLELGGYGDHTHLNHTTRLALDGWTRLHGEHVFPRDKDDEFLAPSALDLSGPPGKLRALVPFAVSYPIGRGVGMYSQRELARHVSSVLDQPLVECVQVAGRRPFGNRRTTVEGRDAVLWDDENLPQILAASGCRKLRILALYRTQAMRTRMQMLLAYHFNRPDLAATGIGENKPVSLDDHIEVLFQPAPELLAHGEHHDQRPALVRQLHGLDAPEDTRLLALCETEYDPKAWARQRRASKKTDSTVVNPDLLDAKHRVNGELAKHHVLAQFLTLYKPGRRNPRKKDRELTTDLELLGLELQGHHRGHMAIADMSRVAGLVHPRLTKALSSGPNGLKEPLVHVGLHLRQQRGERRIATDEPKLMWTLVALVPHGPYWRTLAYLPSEHASQGTWLDYAPANYHFRARPLPEGRRRDELLPRHIDRALYELGGHAGPAQGYVMYVSGAEARSIWPLLANKNLGKTPDATGQINKRPALPGFTLPPDQRPRAVVRVTSSSEDVARPALIERLRHLPEYDEPVTEEGKLATGLFQMDQAEQTFILCNLPHQFTGGARYARVGESYTRWGSIDPKEQAETWYSHTATEITVLHHPADQAPLAYGLAAARLCDHALHWEHRTQYPAPVHLGIQMDKDHPEYRRTVDPTEGDGDAQP
ncbi:RNaseH domain-containing protein [Streptomyces pratensis]|uniref:RNaseH domain-containing protein n=1 Tax=Streptomyces pratensis TaxID=1169025 RepID=UPI0030176219